MKELKSKGYHEKLVGCTGFEAIKKLAKKPMHDDYCYALGEIYYIAGDYDAAFFKWKQIIDPVLVGWSQLHTAAYSIQKKNYELAKTVLLKIDSAEDVITTEKYLHLVQVYDALNDELNLLKTYKMLLQLDLHYEDAYKLVSSYFESKGLYNELFLAEMLGTDTYNECQIDRVLLCLEQDEKGSLSLQQLCELFVVKLFKQGSHKLQLVIRNIQSYMQKHQIYEEGIKALCTAIEKNPTTLGNYFFKEQLDLATSLLDGLYWYAKSVENAEGVIVYLKSCLEKVKLTPNQKKILYSYLEEVVDVDLATNMEMNDLTSLSSQFYRLSKEQRIDAPIYVKYMMTHFFSSEKNVLITGRFNSGKSSFINSMLKEQVLKSDIIPTTSAITVLSHHQEMALVEWTNGELGANSVEELEKVTTIHHEQSSVLSQSLIFLQAPNPVLKDLSVRFIDTPGFFDTEENTKQNPTFTNLHLADEVVFMFAAEEAFAHNEKIIIEQILAAAPDTPISFVLNKVDSLEEEEIEELLEDVERKIYKMFGKKLPLHLYSSIEAKAYRGDVAKFLRDQQNICVFHRIQSVLPYLKSYTEEMQRLIGEQQVKQLQTFQAKYADMERYANHVAEVKILCEQFVTETLQSLQIDFVKPVIARYNALIIDYVRSLVSDLSYEKSIGSQIDEINEKINSFATAIFIEQMSEIIPVDLVSWHERVEVKIRQHINVLRNLMEDLPSFDSLILEPYERLENAVYEQLNKLKQMQPISPYFIEKSDYVQTLFGAVGRIFGMQNNREYMKIDKLKKNLQENSFDLELKKITFYLIQIMDVFETEIQDCLTVMTKAMREQLQNNLRTMEKESNSEALLYKQLSETKASKLEQWNLIKMKCRQLETLLK